jgi:hypothetical protein
VVGLRAAVLLVVATGCVPRVRITVLDSADLVLPPEIRTVSIVDLTDVPEGAAAVRGFTRGFETDEHQVISDGSPDAVVTLSAFDARSELSVEDAIAVRTSRVVLSWQLMDSGGRVLDEMPGSEVADRWLAARDADGSTALPSAEQTIASLAESSGVAYARRFRDEDAEIVRDTFVRGDPRLRFARFAVQSGDWSRAMQLWTEVSRASEPWLAARAHYDLAVGYEVEGQVRRALDHADRAAALDDAPRFLRYRTTLDRANGDQRPLRPATREE